GDPKPMMRTLISSAGLFTGLLLFACFGRVLVVPVNVGGLAIGMVADVVRWLVLVNGEMYHYGTRDLEYSRCAEEDDIEEQFWDWKIGDGATKSSG
ncbi:hypothetical protein NL676_006730, partial [Syzygium grande]